MRIPGTVFVLLLATTLSVAATKELSLPELIAQADSAPLAKQPDLYKEIAQRQMRAANDFYEAGKVDDARAAVQDVVAYSRKAEDTAARSGKKMKDTEIALRKMADKLRDIKRTVSFDDQAPVQAAADELENLRTALLDRMFEKKKKK